MLSPDQLIVQTIRDQRLALGYSQTYMADKMKIGQNAYSKMELGYSKLTIDRLFAVCALLELNVDELLIL